jgi:RNA polymerase sigma-70 factor (ECF subfamily)
MTIVSIHRREAFRIRERSDDPGKRFGRNCPVDDDQDIAPGRDDHTRFSELVLPHLGDAYSLARWITGSRADAEGDNARPWVLTIVRNAAYTWLRKNRPSAVVVVEDLEGVEAAQANTGDPDRETPETALIAKADAAFLQAAIAALPTSYRETLILRDVQGLSYREISDVTGVPIGTVMSRLARGRDHVIKAIGRSAS